MTYVVLALIATNLATVWWLWRTDSVITTHAAHIAAVHKYAVTLCEAAQVQQVGVASCIAHITKQVGDDSWFVDAQQWAKEYSAGSKGLN